jgi:hypothetical protein
MTFIESIKLLPSKELYTKQDLLIPEFLYAEDDKIKIYYAPFDHINLHAKVIIVGITPGWTQMEKSFRIAANSLREKLTWEDSLAQVKKGASFAGTMRINLVKMLDEIGLNNKLELTSSSGLFENQNRTLHYTSILKYPVFSNNKNYSGRNPNPLSSPIMKSLIETRFANEINLFHNALIIPLGKSVSNVISELKKNNLIKSHNLFLEKFPHPSPANGHRKIQFTEAKSVLEEVVENWNY